jgi:L-asparaginase
MTVIVISTGGTIASTKEAGKGVSPDLSGADLVTAVPGLDKVATVDTHEFSAIPSPHFTVSQMGGLVTLISEYDADPEVEGVIVTQGTDILEESAYFVDLCYEGETPIAFTGAMRNPSAAGPDGPANLLAAARTVTDDNARSRGVLVVFNDRVHAPRDVAKIHSMNVDTFRSPEFGPLATVDEDRIVWRRDPAKSKQKFDIESEQITNDVYAVTVTIDMPPDHLYMARESAACCFAATGAGHIPPGIVPALEDLRDRDVPLIATTRCPEGRLARSTYDFRGSETTLQELGCYYSERNLPKTRVKTIVALAADALDRAFEKPDRAS